MYKLSFVLVFLMGLCSCSADETRPVPDTADHSDRPVMLIVGDSLSAGYGIEPGQGWVQLLQDRLLAEGWDYNVVNASVSGDTTSGGLARLKSTLPRLTPGIVVIELGGNDGLRAIQLTVIKSNLDEMIRRSLDAGAQVVLLGMRIPTNYGVRYSQQFGSLYENAAKKHNIQLVEFFLEGVALDASLMQSDGIHPNAMAQPKLLDNVWPAIEAALSGN